MPRRPRMTAAQRAEARREGFALEEWLRYHTRQARALIHAPKPTRLSVNWGRTWVTGPTAARALETTRRASERVARGLRRRGISLRGAICRARDVSGRRTVWVDLRLTWRNRTVLTEVKWTSRDLRFAQSDADKDMRKLIKIARKPRAGHWMGPHPAARKSTRTRYVATLAVSPHRWRLQVHRTRHAPEQVLPARRVFRGLVQPSGAARAAEASESASASSVSSSETSSSVSSSAASSPSSPRSSTAESQSEGSSSGSETSAASAESSEPDVVTYCALYKGHGPGSPFLRWDVSSLPHC